MYWMRINKLRLIPKTDVLLVGSQHTLAESLLCTLDGVANPIQSQVCRLRVPIESLKSKVGSASRSVISNFYWFPNSIFLGQRRSHYSHPMQ